MKHSALLLLLILITGCTTVNTAMPNPMVRTSEEETRAALGFGFNVPENAGNVRYHIINEKMAQMDFDLDGNSYTARIVPADSFTDISGCYFDWTETIDTEIGWCRGEIRMADGCSLCLWYDTAPGLMYSLSSSGEKKSARLRALAESVYSVTQKEQ